MLRSEPCPRMIGPSAILVSLSRAWPAPTTYKVTVILKTLVTLLNINQRYLLFCNYYAFSQNRRRVATLHKLTWLG